MTVADMFTKEVVHLHGFPASIVSDRDRIFMSHFWRELFKVQGTDLRRSTAYHPQSDGQTEIVNKALETYLRCFVGGQPKSWAKWLPWAEYSYNSSPHMSTKFTPFKIVYGRDPPPLLRMPQGQTAVNSLEEILRERDFILYDLHMNLLRAQQRMKSYADLKRREEVFNVGEMVYLKLQPYRQRSLAKRPFEKLAAKFYGPFEVVKKIGLVAYELKLPSTSKLHPVFHVSQLRRAMGLIPASPTIPEQLNSELELVVEPEQLLGVRRGGSNQTGPLEALLKWKKLPDYEATWEDVEMINERFPDFHLEDKVLNWEGSNVIHGTVGSGKLQMYTRRKKRDKSIKDKMGISQA